MRKLKELAIQALHAWKTNKAHFAGMVRAAHILGVEIFPTVGGNGVIVRTADYWVERFTSRDGVPVTSIFKRA